MGLSLRERWGGPWDTQRFNTAQSTLALCKNFFLSGSYGRVIACYMIDTRVNARFADSFVFLFFSPFSSPFFTSTSATQIVAMVIEKIN